MKVLLVGNYSHNAQQSMKRFAELLKSSLQQAGCEVRSISPVPILGRLKPGETGFSKWLGYVDRLLLFPPSLWRAVSWADVVHICDQANAIYLPFVRKKPHVVTCHDVIAIRSALGETREWRTRWSGRLFQRWILGNLQKAQSVVCVSEQTRRDVIRLTGLPSNRVCVVPNSLNYSYSPMPLAEARGHLHRMGIKELQRFFLHVGGNQWYKNRLGVLRIFLELLKTPQYANHYLVMAGKAWTQEMHNCINQNGFNDRVQELINVSNEDLRALYSNADALLYPSFQEGFGWPIIEAQACGCPVVTTNRPPMTDIGGSAAVYIDPQDEVAAAGLIEGALRDAEALKVGGLQNVARFGRDAMLNGYLHAYRATLNNSDRIADKL